MASEMENTEKLIFPELSQRRIDELEKLLPERPRGMGCPASDRSKWDLLAEKAGAREFIKITVDLSNEEFPELPDELYLEFFRNGNRTNCERVLDRRMAMINAFALAECFEHKGRFIPRLEECLEKFLSQKSWVLPAHDYGLKNFNGESQFPDLASSDYVCMLAYIDWFLRDELSTEIRKRIREEVMHRAIAPYQRVYRGEIGELGPAMRWMIAVNNWNAVCTCNMLSACLVFLESRRERAEALAAMEQSIKFYCKGFTNDGYCSEGLGYWAFGFGHFLTMAEIVLDATNGKINILNCNPVIKKCCGYPKEIMIEEGVVPAYADCNMDEDTGEANLVIIQRHFPELLSRPASTPQIPHSINEFKFYLRNLREFALFWFSDDKPVDTSKITPPSPVSFFKDAGVLICRSVDGAGNHFGASIKGGHNLELHNHNDVGSYVIVVNGSSLVGDYGGEVYTRRTFSNDRYLSKMLNSYGHSVPMVAGLLQKNGRDAQAIILESTFSDDVTSILFDISSCYDTKELISLTRRFTFNHLERRLTIADTVEFRSPQTFEDAIVSNAKFDIASKSEIVFHDDKSSLIANISVTESDWNVEVELIENPGKISPNRFAIRLDNPVLKATVKCEFAPIS